MAITDSLRDPATGRIKPVVWIGGIGAAVILFFLFKGSSGTSANGQSSDLTGLLGDLSGALGNLGGGSSGGGSSSGGGGGTGSNTGGGGGQTYVGPPTPVGGGGSNGNGSSSGSSAGGSSTPTSGYKPSTAPANSVINTGGTSQQSNIAAQVNFNTAIGGQTPNVNAYTGFVTGTKSLSSIPANTPIVNTVTGFTTGYTVIAAAPAKGATSGGTSSTPTSTYTGANAQSASSTGIAGRTSVLRV